MRQVYARGGRAATLVSGILVAAVSFVLLTSAVTTSELQVRGTVEENFRPAYDVLVRPEGSFAPLEKERGLVRANYLSGIFGGISQWQYEKVKRLPGVEVAAPIANLGYVLPKAEIPIRVNGVLDDDPVQLYRLRTRWETQRGLTAYRGITDYVYYTRQNSLISLSGNEEAPWGMGEPHEVVPGREKPLPVCTKFGVDESGDPINLEESPFDRDTPLLRCFSELTPEGTGAYHFPPGVPDGTVGIIQELNPPMLLAAIDPEQEDKLLDLDETVVKGRYLGKGEDFETVSYDEEFGAEARQVPVIASDKTYVDATLVTEVERLEIPEGTDVPEVLSDPKRVNDFLPGLPGEVVDRRRVEPGPVYDNLLRTLSSKQSASLFVESGESVEMLAYWSTAPVRYETLGEKRLMPRPTDNPESTWEIPFYYGSWFPAPPGNEDTQFRKLTLHPGNNQITDDGLYRTATVRVVGQFDPDNLPGFSELSEVPLETYYPPTARPADAEARETLGGKPLLPSMNLGDYLSQPPLMLTTLDAAKSTFNNPKSYGKANEEKPISIIRVRVEGVKGPDEASLERIRRVAQAIRKQTGLAVDITAGSSPTPVTVELPEGEYGRPELTLSEGWVQKGVAVEALTGVDEKSAALFGLILLVCGFFLSNGAFASVRARRREFGILLSLGWPRGRILATVLGELALIGLVAGVLGAALAVALAWALSLELSLTRTLLVAPISVFLAVVAGLVPAMLAAKGRPMDALLPPVSPPRSGRPVRSLAAMAARNLGRLPGRTMLGVAGLFVGVGALTVLLGVNISFYDLLVGTRLGNALATQVRPVDYLSVALAIGLGGLSVADVLYLNLRERAPELVTLKTCGWEERHLTVLGLFEGLGMGMIGGLGGAAVGLAMVGLLGGGIPPVLLGLAALAALGGIAVALLASLVPLLALSRLSAPVVLAEE